MADNIANTIIDLLQNLGKAALFGEAQVSPIASDGKQYSTPSLEIPDPVELYEIEPSIFDENVYPEGAMLGKVGGEEQLFYHGQPIDYSVLMSPNFHLLEFGSNYASDISPYYKDKPGEDRMIFEGWDYKTFDINEYKSDVVANMDPDIRKSFEDHVFKYNNTLAGENYKSQIWSKDIKDSHGRPARFMGFLEDNPELYQDVILAADEAGVDPVALYSMYMQEGGADMHDTKNFFYEASGYEDTFDPRGRTTPIYYGDFSVHSFGDIGMDAFFSDQHLALSRGYLEEEIFPVGHSYTTTNEAKMESEVGFFSMKDALRATGATMKLQEDFLRSTSYHDLDKDESTPKERVLGFDDLGMDFNTMSGEEKAFWLYASMNAGHKDAKLLAKAYGLRPWENADYKDSSVSGGDWMDNTHRVVGAFMTMKELGVFNLGE